MALEIFAINLSSFQYFSRAPMPFFLMSSKMGFSSGSFCRSLSLPDSRSFAASDCSAGLYSETSSRFEPISSSAACAVVLRLAGLTANWSPESRRRTMTLSVPSSVLRSSVVGGTTMAFLSFSSGAFCRPLMMTSSPGLKPCGAGGAPPMPPMPGMPPIPPMPPIRPPRLSGPPVAWENFAKILSSAWYFSRALKPFLSTSAKKSFISGSALSFSTELCMLF
mmetsp:Transcript_69998/g.182437  ORF Transcript_69998/g.182437 Transcript_69998/m.182437 type:complete len:222 (+) Transcript_69998:190-855(+)